MSAQHYSKAYQALRDREAEMRSAAKFLRLGAVDHAAGVAVAFLDGADIYDREARECAMAADFLAARLPALRSVKAA